MEYPVYLFLTTCLVHVGVSNWIPRGFRHYALLLPCFFYLSLRYDYGNDYFSYMNIFESVKNFGVNSTANDYERIESGWIWLNSIFDSGNFIFFVVFNSIWQLLAVFILLRYVDLGKYFLFCLAVYIFHPLNMLTLLSAMRQSVALTFFVISLRYIINKNFPIFALFTLIASFFHTTALLLFPIYFIHNSLNRINLIWMISAIFIIVSYVLFVPDQMNYIFSNFISNSSYLDKYDMYLESGSVRSGAMLFFNGFVVIVLSYCFNREREREFGRLFILLTIIGSILSIMSASLIILQRFLVYFAIFSIMSIPISVRVLPNGIYRIGFSGVYLSYLLFIYYSVFGTDTWMSGFGDYQTFLSR